MILDFLFTLSDVILYGRVERIFREINDSILEDSLFAVLSLQKLPLVLQRLTALTGLLVIAFWLHCIIQLLKHFSYFKFRGNFAPKVSWFY